MDLEITARATGMWLGKRLGGNVSLQSRCLLVMMCAGIMVGCAAQTAQPVNKASAATRPVATSRPALSAGALVALEDLEPKPVLAKKKASTQPEGPTPRDAVLFYARARTALNDNDRVGAIKA